MMDIRIQKDDMYASFDVASIFTSIPVDELVRIIWNKLEDNETLDSGDHLNHGCGRKLPSCWMTTLKRLEGRMISYEPNTL